MLRNRLIEVPRDLKEWKIFNCLYTNVEILGSKRRLGIAHIWARIQPTLVLLKSDGKICMTGMLKALVTICLASKTGQTEVGRLDSCQKWHCMFLSLWELRSNWS